MDELKRQTAIIYIEPTQIFFYGGSPPAILELTVPKEILSDQEILSKEKFFSLLETFFHQNSIVPSNIILIISVALTYEKDYPDAPGPRNEELQNFLDIVPFEEVLSKVYRLNKKIKIIAVNRQFCDEFIRSLKQLQSKVVGIVPLSVAQETISEISQKLDLGILLSKTDVLKQHSLIAFETEPTLTVLPEKKSDKKRLNILLGVFAVLVIILIIMIFTSGILQSTHTTIIRK